LAVSDGICVPFDTATGDGKSIPKARLSFMPEQTLPEYARTLGQRAITVPKLITMAIVAGALFVIRIVLGAIIETYKSRAEEVVTTLVAGETQNTFVRQSLAHCVSFGVKYPTTAVVAAFLLLLLLIVVVSWLELRFRNAPETNSVAEVATTVPPSPLPTDQLPTFNPTLPNTDKELFNRTDAPNLRDTGKFLRRINEQWKECVVALREFASKWNWYLNHLPVISGRIGMEVDASREVVKAREAFAKELESLLKLLGRRTEQIGEPTLIGTPDELAHYYSRIASLWGEVADKQDAFKTIEEYVQGHWDELLKQEKDPDHKRFERMFPGEVGLTGEDVQKMKNQMIASGKEWTEEMKSLIRLLNFRFN
jgi:hypothetical protein